MNAFFTIILTILYGFVSNSYLVIKEKLLTLAAVIPLFILINIFIGLGRRKVHGARMKICNHGAEALLLFAITTIISIVYHIAIAFILIPDSYLDYIFSALICIASQAVLFWNGIICVYCTSTQLGIKHRVIGILCGMIPIAHLFALKNIIKKNLAEVAFESEKQRLNVERRELQICKTKYPILFVHGVFFRDSKLLNYWGRIPKELETNGATVYYGEHQSALSVKDSAEELAERIKKITEETGCEKVNIIAHSKGGLDCRYAIAHCGAEPYVASLTTINTPHRGCGFADYLLSKISPSVQQKVANAYNAAARRLGDTNPDFMAAVRDLTEESCKKLDAEMKIPENIFCQSFGSVLKKARSGKFPLNFSFHLVKHFDGANDGLVSEKSFRWGEKYELLTADGDRGISHGDMIDLNRENIEGFDVREFYVQLVSDLRENRK